MTNDGPLAAFRQAARIVGRLSQGLIFISGLLFCVSVAALTLDIVMRAAIGASMRGVQEIASDLFLYAFFFGAAALYARNEDVALTFFVQPLPTRWRASVAFLVSLAIAGSMAVVCYEAVVLTVEQRSMTSADLGISESVRLAPLAIASAVIAFTSLVDAWSCLYWALHGTRPAITDASSAAPGQSALS